MSNVLIKNDMGAELQRLEATNFFRDKPPLESRAVYLLHVAQKERRRFGPDDYLADHYARVAAHAVHLDRMGGA